MAAVFRSDLLSSRSNMEAPQRLIRKVHVMYSWASEIFVAILTYVSLRLAACCAIPRFIAPGTALHIDVLQSGLP